MSYLRDIESMIVFREYTRNMEETYDVRANRDETFYHHYRFMEIFFHDLMEYRASDDIADDVEGFWRMSWVERREKRLKKLIFFWPWGCSCGEAECEHVQLYRNVRGYMEDRGGFEDGISMRIMGFL